jgi:subtilase family serine protease
MGRSRNHAGPEGPPIPGGVIALKRYRTWAAALAVLAAVAVVAAPAGAAARDKLPGSVPSWAKASTMKGAASAGEAVDFRVYLPWRDADGAAALARAVSNPRSSSYGKYLTPAQFRQRFAPSTADVNAVKSWLDDQGFHVVYTPANGHYVAAEGTVSQVESAFAVKLGEYAVAGKTLRAPSSELSVPSSLPVSAVVGVDQSAQLVHTDRVGTDAPPSAGFRNAPPCSSYWAEKIAADLPDYQGAKQPYAPCGWTPAQLRGAYGIEGSGYDGSGQTVAVIDAYASPTIAADVNEYSSRHGLPALRPGQFSQVVAPGTYKRPENPAQDPQGWYGEETLDIEAVHTMAPGAKIVYVGAPNNYQDLDAALNHVVDRRLAQIVTNSYGFSSEFLPPGYIKPYNDTFIQAAIEGIGLYFSSGDGGDEVANLGIASVDWPASSPWVTAVGGTSLGVSASNGYVGETGWGTLRAPLAGSTWGTPAFQYGGGGGTSRLFAEPSYQQGVVGNDLATRWGTPGRVVPDVAMVGDPNTGMLVGQTQTFTDGVSYDEYRIGGTSLSSPLFAGVMALADQAAGAAHGFANPALYGASATAFRDVAGNPLSAAVVRVDYVNGENAADGTTTTLRTLNSTGTIHVRAGYDDVTGRGTPNGSAFINALK